MTNRGTREQRNKATGEQGKKGNWRTRETDKELTKEKGNHLKLPVF